MGGPLFLLESEIDRNVIHAITLETELGQNVIHLATMMTEIKSRTWFDSSRVRRQLNQLNGQIRVTSRRRRGVMTMTRRSLETQHQLNVEERNLDDVSVFLFVTETLYRAESEH